MTSYCQDEIIFAQDTQIIIYVTVSESHFILIFQNGDNISLIPLMLLFLLILLFYFLLLLALVVATADDSDDDGDGDVDGQDGDDCSPVTAVILKEHQ